MRYKAAIESDDVWDVFKLEESKYVEFVSNDNIKVDTPTTVLTQGSAKISQGLNELFTHSTNMKTLGANVFNMLVNASIAQKENKNSKFNQEEFFKALVARWKASTIKMEKKLK